MIGLIVPGGRKADDLWITFGLLEPWSASMCWRAFNLYPSRVLPKWRLSEGATWRSKYGIRFITIKLDKGTCCTPVSLLKPGLWPLDHESLLGQEAGDDRTEGCHKWVLREVVQALASPTTPGTGKSERSRCAEWIPLALEIPIDSLINLLRQV